ncbi:hypothetical protein BDD12DRAFT_838106 [Trichophaea hybrida]|nr:hypothetical protein BDD12DRAFT_838106 [Trichophaea hybrida]
MNASIIILFGHVHTVLCDPAARVTSVQVAAHHLIWVPVRPMSASRYQCWMTVSCNQCILSPPVFGSLFPNSCCFYTSTGVPGSGRGNNSRIPYDSSRKLFRSAGGCNED